jgi:hypothetical protein
MNKLLSLLAVISCSAALATDIRLDMSLMRNGECVIKDTVMLNESMIPTCDTDCDAMIRKQGENCDNGMMTVTMRTMDDECGVVRVTVWRKNDCGRMEVMASPMVNLAWGQEARVELELDNGDRCEVILLGTRI